MSVLKRAPSGQETIGLFWWPVLWMAAIVILGFFVIDIGLHKADQGSNIPWIRRFLQFQADADSWLPMRTAYERLIGDRLGGETLYQQVFFNEKVKFQYPLTSLLIYHAAAGLGIDLTASSLNVVSGVVVVFEALLCMAFVMWLLKQDARWRADTKARIAVGLIAALMALNFYPAIYAFALGQVQTWLNAAFLLAVLFWFTSRTWASGATVGLICLFKPQFGLFLLWAALRRQWGFAGGFLAVALSGGILSVASFGFRDNLAYLDVLSYLSRHGEAFYKNQSVNGFLQRLLSNSESMIWQGNAFPPYDIRIYIVSTAATAAFVLLGLFWRFRDGGSSIQAFIIAGVAFTMASPIAWEHHYGVLLPAICLLAADQLTAPPSTMRTLRGIVFAVAFLAISHDFFYAILTLEMLPPGSIGYSYFFFFVLVILALLCTARNPIFSLPAAEPRSAAGRPVPGDGKGFQP